MTEKIKQSLLNKARLDKFILSFSIPPCLKSSATRQERATDHKSGTRVIPDDLQYSVYGALVPEIDIPSIVLPQYGQHLKVSSHRRSEYTDVTVDFNVDNEFNNYWYIFRWLDILNDQRTGVYDDQGVGGAKEWPKGDVGETGPYGIKLPEDLPAAHADYPPFRNRSDTPTPDLLLDYSTDFTLFGLNEYNKKIIEFTYTYAFPTTLGEIGFSYQDESEISSSFTFSFSQLQVNLL